MSWQDCIAEIRAAAGDQSALSDRDIERLLDQIVRRARRKSLSGMPDPDSIRLATREITDETRRAGLIEQRNRLINLQARIGRRQRIAGAPDLVTGIKAEIHGINTPLEQGGGRFSARAETKALERRWVDGMTSEVQRAGLMRFAKSRNGEDLWTRELAELSKGENGNPGLTRSKEALQLARIVDRYQNQAKDAVNRAGGAIGDYTGYIAHTSHDPDKIRLASTPRDYRDPRSWRPRTGMEDADRAAWKAVVGPLLDERTYDPIAGEATTRDQFLDHVYNGLATGVHLTHEGMQGFKDPEFTGPGNLAKRLSQERVLHFKDAPSWLAYQRRFGQGSVIDSVLGNLERSARATALMHHFGTNPRAEFAADIKYFKEDRRDSDPAQVMRLQQAEHDLQNRFDYLDGTANIPVNRMGARFAAGLRAVQSMANLPLVAFTHLSVASTKAAELRYQGAGLFERYANFFTSLSPRREVHDLLLAGLEGARRDLFSRFEFDDTVPGTLSKIANQYFKWNLLTPLLNMQRRGAETWMSRELGMALDRPHAEMAPELQRVLKLFGIGEGHWAALRQVADHYTEDGRAYLTPDAALRIPDAAAIEHLYAARAINKRVIPAAPAEQRKIDRFRDDLATRLYAYFNDRSEHAAIIPDIDTRADLLRGTRPGTVAGEFARFFAQFKTWPAAMIRQGLGRELYGGQSRPAAFAGIVQMAAMGAVLGYGIMTLKDLIKGRNPRDPNSPKTWAAAMMQGGGLGIFGDYLFGEYDRQGHNFAETVLGPVMGEGVDDALDLWNRVKNNAEGGHADIKATAFRFFWNHVPNTFYTRALLEYLFVWQIQEALNPGFTRRFEQRVKQQNNQTFWLSPSSLVTPGHAVRPRAAPTRPWSWKGD